MANRDGKGLTKEDRSIWGQLKLKKHLRPRFIDGLFSESTEEDEEIFYEVVNRANLKPISYGFDLNV